MIPIGAFTVIAQRQLSESPFPLASLTGKQSLSGMGERACVDALFLVLAPGDVCALGSLIAPLDLVHKAKAFR